MKTTKALNDLETSGLNNVSAVLIGLCEIAFQRQDEASYNIIHYWFDKNENNENLLTKAASYQDIHKATSLHILVGAKAPLALVERIINLAPDSLKVQDEEGRLPLHYASKYGASPNVINLLVDSFPEGINIRDNAGNCPLNYAWATQLGDLLRGADLPEPYETRPRDRRKIHVVNMTGRRLKVEFREAFPRSIIQGGCFTFFGFGAHASTAPFSDPTLGCPGVYVVEPDEVKAFPVRDCEGLYFDFWCHANESYGWAINHPLTRGYTQEIRGQPYRLR
jgi:hypothetical protein